MPTIMNLAINGFGRIGRQALRIVLEKHPDVRVVLINDLTDSATLAHLFEFDSTYGRWESGIRHRESGFIIAGQEIRVTAEKDSAALPHGGLQVDVVLECTGVFRKRADAAKHLEAGAKKVIISAPAKGDVDGTFCLGVNEDRYDPKTMHVISNASCTTNSLAPVAKVLHENFGICYGLMTTIHSYTNDQRILDLPHADLRRARSAAENIIPTSTGAAEAVGLVLPELRGKLSGLAVRVPTASVSLTDLTVVVGKETTAEGVNEALEAASGGPMKGILGIEYRPLVSKDFLGDPRSSIVDAPCTEVLHGTLVKVLAWYDNEWGYACRLVELAEMIGLQLS